MGQYLNISSLEEDVDKEIQSSLIFFKIYADILGISFRNNRDIKDIKINGAKYKISQYADDTSLFTDDSPQSLDGILIFEASKDTGRYNEMFYEHFWFNPEIIDKKSVLFKDLLEQGVRYITDIYKNSNELLSYTELKKRHQNTFYSVSWLV